MRDRIPPHTSTRQPDPKSKSQIRNQPVSSIMPTTLTPHTAPPAPRLKLIRQGKVRDVYELPPERAGATPRLLMVASDRVSAFDVVMPTPIPGKGKLLTELAAWWFAFIERHK